MDTIVKSFSPSFLLRSTFSGFFFVISMLVATGKCNPDATQLSAVPVAVSIAVLAGVTTYTLHRSLFYPAIEWLFDTDRAIALRRILPLISEATTTKLLRKWDQFAGEDKDTERAKHVTTWADYAHFQYVAAECIGLWAFVGTSLDAVGEYSPHSPLILTAVAFTIAAMVSDWRLNALLDRILKQGVPPGEKHV